MLIKKITSAYSLLSIIPNYILAQNQLKIKLFIVGFFIKMHGILWQRPEFCVKLSKTAGFLAIKINYNSNF